MGDREIVSMSSFIDYVMATTTNKVAAVANHRRGRNNPATDFYRPLRETLVAAWAKGRDPAKACSSLMTTIGDGRAEVIFPALIEGHQRFVEAHRPSYFKPVGGLLPAGARLAIAINPELGLVIGGEPHHLKLWFRREPLTQRRVDVTVALMTRLDVPSGHRVAMLDLRNAQLYYLAAKSAQTIPWRKLDALITGEAAGYAGLWGIV